MNLDLAPGLNVFLGENGLHLEQPRATSKLFPQIIKVSDLTQKLKQRLKAIDAHPKVVDKDNLHSSMSWTVS